MFMMMMSQRNATLGGLRQPIDGILIVKLILEKYSVKCLTPTTGVWELRNETYCTTKREISSTAEPL
jgi:hypothetical protein